jgi:PTS system nitrogen regulatory IIA component
MNGTEDDILTIEETAAYLKMKPQTIYKWAQDGDIPAVKIGREWRFKKSLIDKWLDQKVSDKFKHLLS